MKKRIFRSMCLLSAFGVVVTTLAVAVLLYQEFYDNMQLEVQTEAEYLVKGVEQDGSVYLEEIRNKSVQNRLTWIDSDGTVLFDSETEAEALDNHLSRPEVQDAIIKGSGKNARLSGTMGQQIFYYAVRLEDGTVLRVSKTVDSVFRMVLGCVPYLVGIAVLVTGAAMLFAKRQTKRIIQPINNLDLETPMDQDMYEELSPLLLRISRQNASIEASLRALKEQKEEFQSITDHMREGLLVLDNRGSVLSINESARQIFQVQKDEVLHHNILRVSRDEAVQHSVEAALGGENGEGLVDLDGRSYQLLANPVWADGILKGCILLLLDVTERQKAEQQRREFTANVSHELKTPLQSISGYAELLQNGLVKEADVPRFSERIYKEASRLMALVEDIIRLSQLDEGQEEMEKKPVELFTLAKEVGARFQENACQKEVTLTVAGRPAKVCGSRRILEEMIANLCDNAVKYNRAGGTVEVWVEPLEDGTVLTVEDTGIGIPEESRSRVFERFYRVDKSRSKETGGTGLGLSIVKHGAQYHHADLKLISELGKGTRITIRFPKE